MSSVAALIGDPIGEIGAGVHDVTCFALRGSYQRKPAVRVNPDALYPAFHRYADDLSKLEQPYDPIFGMILRDAMVVGQGTVITRNRVLLRDSCRAILEQNHTPPGLQGTRSELFCRATPGAQAQERLSLLLKAPWYPNYGHWLVDSAALLALVIDRLAGRDFQIVVGRQPDLGMRRIVAETLDALAPGVPVLEHDDTDAIIFSELYYVTPVSVAPMFKSPAAIHALRDRLLPKDAVRGRRLYVARPPDRVRHIVNEPEVAELCADCGFEIVRPEEHGLREQARMFAEAEIVVGVKGAALTNLVFSAPDSTVVVLAPNNWAEPFFWDLAGQLDINYVEILGKVVDGVAQPPGSPFRVDLSLLSAALGRTDTSGLKGTSLPEHTGAFYRDCLRLIHETLQPHAYLEVGCLDGATLALAACPTIGIDVEFQRKISVSRSAEALMLFQMTSDDFFRRYDPLVFLGRRIDLAFLDGLHLIENVLRDFINTERFCDHESVIVLHDCLPLDPYMATRDIDDSATRALSSQPGWWTGDVWKMLPILRRYRPHLTVRAFNAPPTGLIVITDLNPDDDVLNREFDRILAEFRKPGDEVALFYQTVPAIEIRETSDLVQSIEKRIARSPR